MQGSNMSCFPVHQVVFLGVLRHLVWSIEQAMSFGNAKQFDQFLFNEFNFTIKLIVRARVTDLCLVVRPSANIDHFLPRFSDRHCHRRCGRVNCNNRVWCGDRGVELEVAKLGPGVNLRAGAIWNGRKERKKQVWDATKNTCSTHLCSSQLVSY